jgi:hypothetical protein
VGAEALLKRRFAVCGLLRPLRLKDRPRDTLLKYKPLGNLVTCPLPAHTRSTYHRTWETGLEVAARVAIANPDFFCEGFRAFPPFRTNAHEGP